MNQRPIDATEGLLTAAEVAAAFRVGVRTAYAWAAAYQADNPDEPVQLAAFQTPGGQWRFSAKAVRLALAGE
jgi:hypothetical protein